MDHQSKEAVNKMIAWGHAYMDALAVLAKGEIDIHHTLDYAYEIWPAQGHRDPAEVAREDFDASA